MKALAILLTSIGVSLSVQAQTEFRDISFAEAQAAAKAEGKMIFIDCYTSWCGPCKKMAREEFPKKEMGDYINPRFVPLKIDMEKGEGPELSKRYDVQVFPTYLVLDAEGNVVYRTLAAMSADKFIVAIDKGINEGGGVVAMQRRYQTGERSEEFIDEYLQALNGAFMMGEIKTVVSEKLQGMTAAQLASDEKAFSLLEKYVDEFESPLFQTAYQGRAVLIERYGERMEKKLSDVLFRQPYYFATYEGKQLSAYDYDRLAAYIAQLKADKITYAKTIDAYFRTYAALTLGTENDVEKHFKALLREDATADHAADMFFTIAYTDKKELAKKLAPDLLDRLNKLCKAETDADMQARLDKRIKQVESAVGD